MATALLCALTIATATPAAALPTMPVALGDDFYSAPADLDAHTPGDVLKTRTRPAPPLVFADITQLEFASTDSLGRNIAAVTTVLTPPNHRPGGPAIVYAHSINSLGLRCAPSRAMWANDDTAMREAPLLNAFLALGWTVILPDHLGPRSAYGAAKLGGQIILDSARATRNATPDAIGSILMAGYSGGAMATAFAAAMAPTYAPELPLVAAAIGGTPTNLETMAETLGHNSHPAFGIAAAVAIGLEREYGPGLPVSDYLNDEGRRFFNQISNACINEILATGFGRSATALGTSFDLFYEPETRNVLRENSIRYYPSAPTIPVYEFHGDGDPLIPLPDLDATMAAWTAHGTPLTRRLVPVPEHMTAAALGFPEAVGFLAAQLH